MTDITKLSKEFCKQNGYCEEHCPGESCDYVNCIDFSDARNVLGVCMKWEDWNQFLTSLGRFSTDGVSYDIQYDISCILRDYITDRTGKLLRLAVEWRRKHKFNQSTYTEHEATT